MTIKFLFPLCLFCTGLLNRFESKLSCEKGSLAVVLSLSLSLLLSLVLSHSVSASECSVSVQQVLLLAKTFSKTLLKYV